MESLAIAVISNDMKMRNGISLTRCNRSMGNGRIIAVTPRMSKTLAILEPNTLPMAISPLLGTWLSAEDTETNNSGALVPMPTIVRPIMKLEILARWAMATDESTR